MNWTKIKPTINDRGWWLGRHIDDGYKDGPRYYYVAFCIYKDIRTKQHPEGPLMVPGDGHYEIEEFFADHIVDEFCKLDELKGI